MNSYRDDDVVLLSGARTPIGSFMGSLSSFKAPQLGAIAIMEAIRRGGVNPNAVDELIFGNVLSAGLGQAPARQASLGAGLKTQVPCLTVNKVCGSGMKAAMLAGQSILLKESSLVIAGGMESMSSAPYLLDKARSGYRMGNGILIDSMITDGLWDPYGDCHMGTCADATAVSEEITRQELDNFASESYRRALDSIARGIVADEIIGVEVLSKKTGTTLVDRDEEPFKGDPAKMPNLRPAFGKDGTTTAGNASSLNDGACALVISSGNYARAEGLTPICKIVGWSTFAQDPAEFTTAPAGAIEKLLTKQGLSVSDVDLYEINEAFAVVAMSVSRRLRIPDDKLNVNGGAVAFGHPIGMTGARLILTAALELRRRGGRFAVASPCIGGGESTAILIENV